MNQPRILLWVGLLLLVYLNVNAWLKDYAPAVRETPATESKPPNPGASPADGLSAELPSVTSDAPPVAAATDMPPPEAAAAPPAGSGKVRIVTDVLDVDLSLAGGELIRADLTRYPLHKDDPSTPVRLFNTDSGVPLPRERLAAGSQLLFPGGKIIVARILLQRRIALTERLLVAPPVRQERRFHVEHAPVQKPAPTARAFLEKLVDFRIDDLRRELLGQVGDTCRNGAAHMPLGAAPGRAHTQRHDAGNTDRAAGQHEGILAVADQGLAPTATEGAPAAQEKRGLEQAGLARGIRSNEEICAGIEL